ncbi:hypothetical protein QOZ80_3BG0291340 [Eleusine coracana subsp. coracana]|nr:hypothetical protein QOZ80_3BG0291340 [Eleusine coracana subsp. coracana]
MKRQSKRPTSSHGSTEPGDNKLVFPAEDENLTARSMDHHEEDTDVDDEEEELSGGRGALSSSCGLGEKKRRLALDQVRALERSFEADNKLDPDRKARIARDLGLQPRQVAVWFQNRRARWKTKQLERDFAALRARHDALRADCDALRHDKDALAAEIRELREKLSKQETAMKVEAAGNNEDRQAPVAASATAAVYKDGSSDSDSSVVINDVEASPYSGAVFEQPPPQAAAFVGFGGSFMDSSATTTMGCSSLPSSFGTKWAQHGSMTYPCDSYKGGNYGGFTDEWLAGSDVISNDGAVGFFSDAHASSLNFGWCASGADGWD